MLFVLVNKEEEEKYEKYDYIDKEYIKQTQQLSCATIFFMYTRVTVLSNRMSRKL